jgi:hypothetical protein
MLLTGPVAQYLAWCRHNGTYSTPKRPFRRWNIEITEMATSEIEPMWKLLRQEFLDMFIELGEGVSRGLQDLVSTIPGKLHFRAINHNNAIKLRLAHSFNTIDIRMSSQTNTAFLDIVNLRQKRIGHLLRRDWEKFRRRLMYPPCRKNIARRFTFLMN